MSSDKRHVAFNESPSFGLGTIDVALEKGAEAVAQGANKVASYIPGMAAHELKKQEDQLKAQNIDYHVADGNVVLPFTFAQFHNLLRLTTRIIKTCVDIAYTRGPSYKADPASDTPFQHHTADEIAFVHGPSDSPSAPEESPKKDMIHTADDIEFVKGNIVSFPGRKKAEAAVAEHCRADDVHTADGTYADSLNSLISSLFWKKLIE